MQPGEPPAAPWHSRVAEEGSQVLCTTAKSASGTKSVMITYDAEREDWHKQGRASLSRTIADTGHEGRAVFEGSMLFSPSADTRIVISLHGGPRGTRVVSLLNCLGKISFGHLLVWRPVRADTWYRFRFEIDKSRGTADLSIGEKDGAWQNTFVGLPIGDPEEVFPIRYVTIHFGGQAKKGVRAYFDDLRFESGR